MTFPVILKHKLIPSWRTSAWVTESDLHRAIRRQKMDKCSLHLSMCWVASLIGMQMVKIHICMTPNCESSHRDRAWTITSINSHRFQLALILPEIQQVEELGSYCKCLVWKRTERGLWWAVYSTNVACFFVNELFAFYIYALVITICLTNVLCECFSWWLVQELQMKNFSSPHRYSWNLRNQKGGELLMLLLSPNWVISAFQVHMWKLVQRGRQMSGRNKI